MRSLLTALALLLGAAALTAQNNPPAPLPKPASTNPPAGTAAKPAQPNAQPAPANKAAQPEPAPVTDSQPGPPEDTYGPIVVGVLCAVAILFAVCYPMRRED